MPKGSRFVAYPPVIIGLADLDLPNRWGLYMESVQDSRTLAATGFPGVSNW